MVNWSWHRFKFSLHHTTHTYIIQIAYKWTEHTVSDLETATGHPRTAIIAFNDNKMAKSTVANNRILSLSHRYAHTLDSTKNKLQPECGSCLFNSAFVSLPLAWWLDIDFSCRHNTPHCRHSCSYIFTIPISTVFGEFSANSDFAVTIVIKRTFGFRFRTTGEFLIPFNRTLETALKRLLATRFFL